MIRTARHLREHLLRGFAESRNWKVIEHQDPFRQLELRDFLALQEIDQLVEAQALPALEDEARAHLLAEARIGYRHAGDVLHRRVRKDQVLDLLGADLL